MNDNGEVLENVCLVVSAFQVELMWAMAPVVLLSIFAVIISVKNKTAERIGFRRRRGRGKNGGRTMKILKNTIGSIVLLVAALFVFTACSTVSVGSVDYEKDDYSCSGSFTVKVSGGDAEYINYDIMLYNGNELADTTHTKKAGSAVKTISGYYTVNLYVFVRTEQMR